MDNKVNEFLAIKGLKNRLKWINDNLEDTQLLAILKIVKLKLNATVHGNTLLYIAIKNHGDDSLPGNNNNLKAITLLINAGADPNIHAGLSPLMMTQISPQGWATQRPDNTIITQLLIDAGDYQSIEFGRSTHNTDVSIGDLIFHEEGVTFEYI